MIVECDDSIIIDNELPVHIHYKHLKIEEFMTYQCLPIKFPGMTLTVHEDRLNVFNPLLVYIYQDFYETYGYDRYVDSYIYITAKHRRVSPDCSMNRPGYHIDGFGETNVVNYIWSNCFPTIFNSGKFEISYDDKQSLIDMETQAKKELEVTYNDNTILRLNNYVIHKTAPVTSVQNRAFFKITFSKNRYNLVGNSHNYLLKYNWIMKERESCRNIQHK